MKKIISFFLFIFLTSCGYTSVYKNNDSRNLFLVLNELNGDDEINNLIKNELELYTGKDSENKFLVDLDTEYSKSIISKNSTGTSSNYKLLLIAKFDVTHKKRANSFIFQESFNMNNISDSFEQKNYENNIKKNFASSIRKKLILKLINM